MKYDDYRRNALTGDIVLVAGTGLAADIIQTFSKSKWSHVGMVVRPDPMWSVGVDMVLFLESTLAPSARDLRSGEFFRGVRLVPLSEMLQYEKNRRAKIGVRTLTSPLGGYEMRQFTDARHELMGRPYERNLLELWKSVYDGPLGRNKTALHSVFCSELVAEMLIRMGMMAPERPSNEYTPADFASRSRFTFPMLPPWSYDRVRMLTL